MKIEVGRSYAAECTAPDTPGTWVFDIVSEVAHANGERFFMGLMMGDPCNVSAYLFTEQGETPETGDYDMGFRIKQRSRTQPRWVVFSGRA